MSQKNKVQIKQYQKNIQQHIKLEDRIEESNNFREVNQQDGKIIQNLVNLLQSKDRLIGGQQQIQLKETNQLLEQLNNELEIDVKDLKNKEIDFTCSIHLDNVCLIDQLLVGKPIYYPKNCDCKTLYCNEILKVHKCPTCRKIKMKFVPVIRGDMYLAQFVDVPENTPNELKIVMFRLSYLYSVLNIRIQSLVQSMKEKEQLPQQPKFFGLKIQNDQYQIPELMNYDSFHKKLIKVIKTYQEAKVKIEEILKQ